MSNAVKLSIAIALAACESRPRVLVFSKTAGFRHDSIPAGIAALTTIAQQSGLSAEASEDFPADLSKYSALVFLHTTGDVLDAAQQAAFEHYVRGGGGFMGIHAAADSGYAWSFYGQTVGAYFKDHPAIQPATLVDADTGMRWQRTDEWYNFQSNPRPSVHVILTLDESTMTGGEMGADHPVAWCHGRAFYTALGHTIESYSEPQFLDHLRDGLRIATGGSKCPVQ